MNDILSLVFAGISAVAAVISAVAAFGAKFEVKRLSVQTKNNQVNHFSDNEVSVANSGTNSGIMSGINTGDISNGK